MSIQNSLVQVLQAPTAEGLWELRGDLLETGLPKNSPAWSVVGNFHSFLERVSQAAGSREYSHLASLLDIGAVGGVVVGDLLQAGDPKELAQRLLGAVISESLMILATRQHVKAWEMEMASTFKSTAWYLYDQIWYLSLDLKPELPKAQRRKMIEELLRPVLSPATGDLVKAAVIGRLFQLLLVWVLGGSESRLP